MRLAVVGLGASLLAAMGLLGACGYMGGSEPGKSAHPLAHSQGAPPLDAAAQALAGMVDAVELSGSESPVELKFSIRSRPEVGQDDEIDYALVPRVSEIEQIHVAFGALDGLEVRSHGPLLAAVKPASGVPILGSVTVRPTQTGLFTLTAAVGVQSPNESRAWTFRIPIITAEGPAQTAAVKR